MKELFKKEIEEKTTIGRVFIESLIYAAFITGIIIYVAIIFTRPEMQTLAKAVKKYPISTYFVFLPVVIMLVETITISLAMLKIPDKKNSTKKKTNKNKSNK